MPTRARARGMPTAQPMMRPRLDFEPPLEEEEESLLEELEPAVGVGVTRTVFWIVTTPPPALVERLWTTELKGMVAASSAVAVAEPELGASVEGEPEEPPAVVLDAWFPPPDPPPLDARPVIVARLGAVEAWFWPIVAYASPSCSAKKGRGEGDSLQQFTFTLSALQHHWSSWSLHCVIDSPPTAF